MSAEESSWLKAVDAGQERLTLVGEFPRKDLESLFRFWIEPDILSKWWPPQVELSEPKIGGEYVSLSRIGIFEADSRSSN